MAILRLLKRSPRGTRRAKIEGVNGATALFFGTRPGAIAAARRLGLRVLLLSERRPARSVREQVAGHDVVDFGDPGEVAVRASRLCDGVTPAVAVALIEAAVVPAAAVRSALGIDGLDLSTAMRCHDKLYMKTAIRAAGIRCADFAGIGEDTRATDLIGALGLPVVLKPRTSSGGRGTAIAADLGEVRRAMAPGLLAERFVPGIEMSVESIVAGGRIRFVNHTEYFLPRWSNIVPAVMPEVVADAVDRLNREAIAALRIDRGIIHLELFLTPDGMVFGELAVRPPGGYLMDLIAGAYGFDPWEALLRVELGQIPDLPQRARQHTGVWILHPGPGVLRGVHGLEDARAVPGVERLVCRIEPGDHVDVRAGVGNDVGRIVVHGPDRDTVATGLRRARNLMAFELEPTARAGLTDAR